MADIGASRAADAFGAPDTAYRLPRLLAAAYAILIGYACLHPMSGWQQSGLPLFDFLLEPWPRYLRTEDLVLNVLGFVPLGLVLAPALPRKLGWLATVLIATLLGGLLSLSVETLQNFLPTRISSNVDLGCNTLGSLMGAVLGATWGRRLFAPGGGLQRWRASRVIPGRTGDVGLILLGLWLLTQLMPDSQLFGNGDIRKLLDLPTPMSFEAERFIRLEAIQVAAALVAIGLFARCMMRRARPWSLLLLVLLGIGAKALATQSFFVPGSAIAWLTPGTRIGLLVGAPLLVLALALPRVPQHALAGTALLVSTTMANLIPDNPYLAVGQQLLERGNFLNFHGLTQVVAAAWPFLALGYLSALGLWRGEHLNEP